LQRFAALFAALCSGIFLRKGSMHISFTPSQKMNISKLIARWWWLVIVLLFLLALLYFIWHSQQRVNAIDKELYRPELFQPHN
jgi:type II secretory pathway component PulF